MYFRRGLSAQGNFCFSFAKITIMLQERSMLHVVSELARHRGAPPFTTAAPWIGIVGIYSARLCPGRRCDVFFIVVSMSAARPAHDNLDLCCAGSIFMVFGSSALCAWRLAPTASQRR